MKHCKQCGGDSPLRSIYGEYFCDDDCIGDHIESLTAERDQLRAKLRRSGEGRAKTGPKTQQTYAQEYALRKLTAKMKAMWTGGEAVGWPLNLAAWVDEQFNSWPPETQSLRPLTKWQKIAAKW